MPLLSRADLRKTIPQAFPPLATALNADAIRSCTASKGNWEADLVSEAFAGRSWTELNSVDFDKMEGVVIDFLYFMSLRAQREYFPFLLTLTLDEPDEHDACGALVSFLAGPTGTSKLKYVQDALDAGRKASAEFVRNMNSHQRAVVLKVLQFHLDGTKSKVDREDLMRAIVAVKASM